MTLDSLIVAVSAALLPCMLALFALSMCRNGWDPHRPMSATSSILMLLSLLSAFVEYSLVRAWLLGYTDRFLMHKAIESHLFWLVVMVAAPCMLLLGVGVRTRWSDSHKALPRTASEWSSLLLPSLLAACLVAALVNIGTRAHAFVVAQNPAQVHGTVADSYHYKHRFNDGMRLAKIQLEDGTSLYATARDSFFANRLHQGVLVNGTCPLDQLPIGLNVTASIRRSPEGIALDSIQSNEPCAK